MHTAIIVAVVCACFALAWFILIKCKKSIEQVVLVSVIVFGVLSNFVMVPGFIPDEPAHIITAYRYANVLLFQPYATENGGLMVRKEDVPIGQFAAFLSPRSTIYQETAEQVRFFCSAEGTELVEESGRDVKTGFIAYVPSAIGIALGRILHLGTYPMVYLARLCNLLCYALCLYWTIRITPVKKYLFALLGFTPMAMQLAGSLSYDVPIIGLAFLFTAYVLRLIYLQPRIGWREWVICAVLSFLLVPCKFIYTTLLLLLLLIPREKFGGLGKKTLFVCCVGFCGLLGFVLQAMTQIQKFFGDLSAVSSSANNVRQTELYTMGWMLSHPKDTIQMVLHTIRQDFNFFWENMLGGRISVFEPVVDWMLILLCALLVGSMRDPDDALEIPFKHRLVCISAFGITFLGALLTMLFIYTPYGNEVIEGVQGRYLLPVLPMLFLFLGSNQVRLNDEAKRWVTTIVIACNGATLIEVLMWILEYV